MNDTPVSVLFLDLDGTVRKSVDDLGHFVNGPSDVEVFPAAVEMMRIHKESGGRIVGVSNQGGIALGHMTMEECAAAMLETQRQCEGLFDKIAWCRHHPRAQDPEMAVCWCRKPRIGLLVESCYDLAAKHNEYYPPHLGLFVGDMDSDRETAAAANLSFLEAGQWRSLAARD